jgi:hypothetical protein
MTTTVRIPTLPIIERIAYRLRDDDGTRRPGTRASARRGDRRSGHRAYGGMGLTQANSEGVLTGRVSISWGCAVQRKMPSQCRSGLLRLCSIASFVIAPDDRPHVMVRCSPPGSGYSPPSTAVIDMVHAGKLDEAERAARDLLVRFPEVHDGYDRLRMVYEARGDHKQAADSYRQVIDFVSVSARSVRVRI